MGISKLSTQRRAELIYAAHFLFDKNGVEHTRVSDIVKYVGVAQGVFYYYFSSKAEIVDVVAKQVSEEIEQHIFSILSDETSCFHKRMANYISLYINVVDQFLGDDEENNSFISGSFYHENIFMQKGRQILFENWELLIHQGISSGNIAIKYPLQTAQVLVLGLFALSSICLPTPSAIYTIVEQSFHFPSRSLTQFLPTNKKGEKE